MLPPGALSQRARRASGQPISELMHRALANPELISLAAGFVDQATLPVDATRAALDAVLGDRDLAHAALQYGTTPGYLPLREVVLARQLAADGTRAAESRLSVDQVVLTAGSNQLLHLLGDTLLDPGDIVLCGAPMYFVFLGMLNNLGARAVGVETDGDGVIPEALNERLARCRSAGELPRVKALYVTSYYDNPATTTLPAARRAQIVEIARRWSRFGAIYVIEDAAYRDLRYVGDDIPSLRAFDPDGQTVIVTQTYSKSYSPGIRVGYGILPRSLVATVCDQKGNIDFGSPNFNQHLMHKVIEGGHFDQHVTQLRDQYRTKLGVMNEALEHSLATIDGVRWSRPRGGLYVWLRLPDSIDTGPNGPLFDRAVEQGTLYVPGEYCYPASVQPRPTNAIRLSFGVQSPERIRRGVEALAAAIEHVRKGT